MRWLMRTSRESFTEISSLRTSCSRRATDGCGLRRGARNGPHGRPTADENWAGHSWDSGVHEPGTIARGMDSHPVSLPLWGGVQCTLRA